MDRFDTDKMRNASRTLSRLSEEYTSVYKSLIEKASTMGDAYNTPDNQAYVEQIKGCCNELKAMADHLLQASQALELQAKNLEEHVNTNIRNAKKLAN